MKGSRFKLPLARRGINPTFIFFLMGVASLIVGIVIPFLWPLALLGGFIVLVYLVTAIVWVCFSAH